jgi:hypothetical protein
MDTLCECLQDEYKINMKSHVGALNLILRDVTSEPAARVALGKPSDSATRPTRFGHVAKRMHTKRRNAKRGRTIDKIRMAKKNEPKRALSPSSIFGSETRPTIIEAFRSKGEKINAAGIRKHIAALWDAETDKDKYYDLARRDQERYADEKAAFDWEETSTPKRRRRRDGLVSFEDAAQTPPTVLAPRSASVATAAASVYSYATSYLQPFFVMVGGSWLIPRRHAVNERAGPPCS